MILRTRVAFVKRYLLLGAEALALVGLGACAHRSPQGVKSGGDAVVPQSREEPASEPSESEQAVLVHLRLSDDRFGTEDEVRRLQELEVQLEDAIAQSGAGMLDGNEIGQGE